jgi:hypothetical protein
LHACGILPWRAGDEVEEGSQIEIVADTGPDRRERRPFVPPLVADRSLNWTFVVEVKGLEPSTSTMRT